MPDNLRSDFRRLLRQSSPIDPRAPWWVNWLMQLVVLLAVVWGIAAGIDWLWSSGLGREPWAMCLLIGWLPWGLSLPLGMLIGTIGLIAFFLGARGTGIGMFVVGMLIYSLPDFMMASGFGLGCAS